MSENQQLLDKVKGWLTDEELNGEQIKDEKTDFHLLVANAYKLGFSINIGKIRTKPIIQIALGTKLPLEIKQAIMAIDERERFRFFGGVQRELLKFNVEHAIIPNKKEPDSIEIRHNVYVEDMTRTIFMESLRQVKLAALFMIWSITNKFSTGTDISSSQTPFRSPYG